MTAPLTISISRVPLELKEFAQYHYGYAFKFQLILRIKNYSKCCPLCGASSNANPFFLITKHCIVPTLILRKCFAHLRKYLIEADKQM